MMKPTRLLPLAALISAAFSHQVFAADETAAAGETQSAGPTVEIQQVNVRGRRATRPTVEHKNSEQLKEELINDNKDLVRYSPDVGVADQGRHSKGFAIRGVEDNRVGISIDGVALPDSEENSLYKRYGNLNTSRQSIDTELARSVEVVKGADSFNQGSGNLGGGVNYRTLEPGDIVTGESPFGAMLRTGYASKNREWFQTIGSAYQGEKADAVLLFSNRHGHETKSAGGFTIPEDSSFTRTRRNTRQIPDSAEHNNKSYLAKYAYRFSPEHRAGISYSGQRGHNYIIEDSATTLQSWWRESEDSFDRKTANAFYEYTPDSTWLAALKADVDYQRADTWAVNDEGRRESFPVYSWERYQPREPSDRNIRIFKTDLTRFNLRMDTQPLSLGKTDHSLSLKTAISEKNFDVLHKDSFYLSNAWQPQPDSTMMHPIETRQYYVSLNDKIRFSDTFSGYAGLRYDHAKHAQQDLNGLSCNNCVKAADSKFKQFTWAAGLDAKLTPSWQVGYNIGTGFRIPNASEMYFDYRNNRSGAWMSNPNLKAERSLTQGLNLRGNGSYGQLSIGLHHTGYKDFLYEQETWGEFTDSGITTFRPVQQMQNIDSAKIYGLEATGRLNLDRITPLPQGWKLFGSVGLSKGSMDNGADLLSLQPLKAIIGLDYEDPEGKYGVFSRLTYMAAKKAKDAKYQKAVDGACLREEFDFWLNTTRCLEYEHLTSLETWPHLNKKAVVFDLFGYYKPSKNFTVRAGVYNLFNRKYHTWDTLRGLNITGGVVNSVGLRENYTYGGYPGLQRYYNPGRNYTVSLEWKF